MALQMLDVLPPDTLDVMSCFLTGWDLFQLSHINAQCWRHFAHSTHWDRRLKPGQHKRNTQSPCSLKRAYARTRSFVFEGLRLDERLSHCGGTDGSGGVIVQDPSTRESFTDVFTGGSAFAVDTWFSLLDGDCDGILTGGVLFGGQSPLMRTCMWTNHHVAFVGVDGDRNLFCSMLDGPANCVSTGVDFGRWYHLVLSYDGGVQKIYLDGELVSQMEGMLHHSWHELSQIQVGTGNSMLPIQFPELYEVFLAKLGAVPSLGMC
ncbi:ATP-binding Cassette (ABC) Superfamily [Phytophthora cinnamomi]|uniref:ATP-binding Cassette (ABC) Superfamily n=1 Tax=Phytophthora cinnamomi TaxID=4785 RepID=UPI0035598C92|nr:ATP-binding Cassette (ABC) Superfamily [Phytophthora cinnamomi]